MRIILYSGPQESILSFTKGQRLVLDLPIVILAVAEPQEHWRVPGPRYKVQWGSQMKWLSEPVLRAYVDRYARRFSIESITLDLKIG